MGRRSRRLLTASRGHASTGALAGSFIPPRLSGSPQQKCRYRKKMAGTSAMSVSRSHPLHTMPPIRFQGWKLLTARERQYFPGNLEKRQTLHIIGRCPQYSSRIMEEHLWHSSHINGAAPSTRQPYGRELSIAQMESLEAELQRTGIGIGEVQERYHIKDPTSMPEEIYGRVMKALARTKSAGVA